MGYILVQKLEFQGQKYMSFKNLKNQVEGMLRMGYNDVYWALKVNICSLLLQKFNLVPKNLVEASFLIIYTPILLVSIKIDIPGTKV